VTGRLPASSRGTGPAELLPPEVLERLGGLEVAARTVVAGFQGGIHRSPFVGSGEEFSRHRAYQQGDDLRTLDWRLFGRTDRLFVRQYRESSNLQAYLLVDRSLSMDFREEGGVTKLRYALLVAAALAHLMLRGGDAVGLASVGSGVTLHLPPRNRPGQLHDLLLGLEGVRPEGGGGLPEGVDRVGEALRRRGRVIVLSDLLDPEVGAFLGAVGRLRARGDEVMVLRPLTLTELGEAGPGAALWFDPEAPGEGIPGVPGADPAYRGRLEAHFRLLAGGMEERGVEYLPLRTSDPLVPALAGWLRRRSGEGGR